MCPFSILVTLATWFLSYNHTIRIRKGMNGKRCWQWLEGRSQSTLDDVGKNLKTFDQKKTKTKKWNQEKVQGIKQRQITPPLNIFSDVYVIHSCSLSQTNENYVQLVMNVKRMFLLFFCCTFTFEARNLGPTEILGNLCNYLPL